jgi:hypothetical protein
MTTNQMPDMLNIITKMENTSQNNFKLFHEVLG